MKSRIARTTFVAFMMTAGVAAAQSVPVTVSNQGSAVAPSANASAVTLGNFTLVSNQSGSADITAVPLTLTTGSGGNASDLSQCQVYSSNGSVLAASGLSTVSNGLNTATFDSPVPLAGNQSMNFTVRCNTGSNIASGATYQFTAGVPTLDSDDSTSNPTGPALGVLLGATPVARPGAQDTPMGVITLGTYQSNSAIQVRSLPISMSFAGGVNAGMITDCRVRNAGTLASPLNSGSNVPTIVSGTNTLTLDNPLIIPAGDSAILVLTCDIASSAPSGSTVLLSITPSAIAATVSGSGASVTPVTGSTPSGNTGETSGSVLISASAPITGGPLIPGAPNTGLGGESLMVIVASAIAMLFGAVLLRRRMA